MVLVVVPVAAALGVAVPAPASGSCVGPLLSVGVVADGADPPSTAAVLRRGHTITVTGEWFHSGCADSYVGGPGCSKSPARPIDPEAPLTDVPLTLHQASRTWTLDTADASGPRYSVSWSWELPAGVAPGSAELRAGTATLPVTIGP